MTLTEMLQTYWEPEQFPFPTYFEHRFDPTSSAMMYALVRAYRPQTCLEIGPWRGGSTNVILAALQKNDQPFTFQSSELLDNLRDETRRNVLQERGVAPEMLGDITKNLDKIPASLDFLFLDDDHDLPTTEWIEAHIFPRVKPGGLFIMHDWAVEEVDGKLVGKGEHGTGGWPETQYLMDQITAGKFPFQKIHFTYHNPGREETGFWEKR